LAHANEFSDIRFKSGEKGLYKELNGDIGIKFPIKVDIAQHPHKVSLLIQSELGGSLFPNHEKWKKHRTQFNMDKNMVFSHVNRLIRCVIDCQLQLEDAVSVRNALELARSLAARVWDNSPYQMKQIDAIGEAGVRKLAQAGISSIETLQNTEPHRIERILNRNPPFGQKVLAKAVEFPNLHVSVKEMGKESRPGHGVKIRFKAEVGFVNEKLPITFRKKSVYVCFLAETSDGQLIDFRRFAAKKLEHGQEILLSVHLVRPTTSINCHIMCDEIAGTNRRAEFYLEHFPASSFPTPELIASKSGASEARKANTTARAASKNAQDLEDYGDLDDADLLAALDNNEDVEVIHDIDQITLDNNEPAKRSVKRAAHEMYTDQQELLKSYKEPVQLANGNWTCQHTCKEDGKSCKHKCCVVGVEKPARPGRKKPTKKNASTKGSLEDITVHQFAKSTPFDKARFQAEAKKHKSVVPRTHETKNSTNRYDELTAIELEQMNSAQSTTPAHRYQKGTALKLSFMQNPYGLSNDLADSVEGEADPEEDSANFELNLPTCLEKRSANLSDDKFNFEIDDEMDNITIENMGKKPISPKSDACEIIGVSKVREDGLPASVHPRHKSIHQLARPTAYELTDTEGPSATTRSLGSNEHERNSSSPELGNEADFGAFNAPLSHLSPAATQRWAPTASNRAIHEPRRSKRKERGMFITGESSSPEKTSSKACKAVEEVEEYADVAVEAFFASLEATDYGVSDPPAKKQKLIHDSGELSLSPKAVPELQNSNTKASLSLKGSETSRQPLKILQNGQYYQQQVAPEQGVSGAPGDMPIAEEAKEKDGRDEELKKWEGFEDFYEQFGEYVEIIE
jgi:hypothetical protein